MSKIGSHDPFRHLKHKVWPKEGPRIKLDSQPLKVNNHLISLRANGVPYTIGKVSMMVTTLL
jgi:hypothetical protein